MGGLIWSGIGQGIMGAGQAIGGAMMKDTEYQRQLEAESRREENYIRRMEEAQRIKDDAAERKAEELQQRVIKETAAAQEAARDIPMNRVVKEVASRTPSMSEDEIKQMLTERPELKQAYEKAGVASKKNESLERTEGAIAAAMAAGSSSTTILNLQKQRTAVLDEIRQDFKERQEVARADRFEKQTEQTGERIDILAKNSLTQAANSATMAKNANTAETRANREGSTRNTRETTADLQRQVDSAKDALAEKLGVSAKELYPEIQRLEKRAASDSKSPASIKAQATLDDLQENRDQLKAARSKLDQWTAKVAKEETPPAAETAPPKPNIAIVKEAPAGSSVGNYSSRGWEIKDKTGKVLGYWKP